MSEQFGNFKEVFQGSETCGVSDVGLGFAVMNRMMKSAGYNIINLTEEKVGQKIDSRGENDTLPI